MARFRFVLGCLVAGMFIQAAIAASQSRVVAQTKHGLALPGSSSSSTQVSDQEAVEDASYYLQDTYADEEYIMELERQELEDIQHMVEEEQQQKAAELAAAAAATAGSRQAESGGDLRRLPVPFELSAAQPVMAMANTFSREVRNAVEQAQAMAAQLLKSQGTMKALTGGAITSNKQTQQRQQQQRQQEEEAAPVNVIELAQTAANLLGSGEDGYQIDVTVTTERTGPTFMLPSLFPSNMPAMFGFGSSSDASSSSDSARQVELAAEIAQSVIESALASQAAGSGEQELILDMTVEDAGPQSAQKLVAAAAAAAASAAASAALNKQPWDTLELEMEVVETIRPFFRSGRFMVIGMLLLTVQLLLCFAVAFLWAREGDEEDECEEYDEEQVDLKQQKQQEWASMAEEGRGLYEKLLSYT